MKLTNLAIYTVTSSIWGFAMGILGPFYVIFVQKIGGSIENLGFAFGIMVMTQSITSYFFGKYSDKLGRKPFLIATGFLNSAILFAFTFIQTVTQLYAIQIIWGITDAMDLTISTAFLGDITKKTKRGSQIGKYNSIIGIVTGFAMIVSGIMVGMLGFQSIFYVGSMFYLVSACLLFWIKEKVNRWQR